MQNEYFGISNCVFNFNFLALAVSEILGESQIYTRGPYAPWMPPSGEIFVPNANTSQYLIFFKFKYLAVVLYEILGGSQIYIRGPCAPRRLLAEKF